MNLREVCPNSGSLSKAFTNTWCISETWCPHLSFPSVRPLFVDDLLLSIRYSISIHFLFTCWHACRRLTILFKAGTLQTELFQCPESAVQGLPRKKSEPLALLHQDINCGNLLTSEVDKAPRQFVFQTSIEQGWYGKTTLILELPEVCITNCFLTQQLTCFVVLEENNTGKRQGTRWLTEVSNSWRLDAVIDWESAVIAPGELLCRPLEAMGSWKEEHNA